MANFKGSRDYNITYKRGGRILDLIAEAEWLVKVSATHVLIDGVQNSVREIVTGKVSLEGEVLERLKEMNKKAVVVLAEVLYCPEHAGYEARLHQMNRQIGRMNKAASGLESPKPWTVLARKKRNMNRKKKDVLRIHPGSFKRDGYHISNMKLMEYEENLNRYMKDMVYTRLSDICYPKPEIKCKFVKNMTKHNPLNEIEID